MPPAQLHVVVGAGPVGAAIARKLAGDGRRVRLVTRSGSGPDHPLITRVAADAADPDAFRTVCRRAAVMYNCASPGAYSTWQSGWPPLAAGVLRAAEESGAVLVNLNNVYGYGRVTAPITREMPLRPSEATGVLRSRLWTNILAAHRAGRVRATEARASDYLGPTVPPRNSIVALYANATLADRPAWVFTDPDQPHTWTAVSDIAATMIALGADERAWGSPWIVPSNDPISTRALLTQLARDGGAEQPRLRRAPRVMMRIGGIFVPVLRDLAGVLYQFDAPFRVDGSATTHTFGVAATAWRKVIARTAPIWRQRAIQSRSA